VFSSHLIPYIICRVLWIIFYFLFSLLNQFSLIVSVAVSLMKLAAFFFTPHPPHFLPFSGKAQRVEPLGHVVAAKVLE